MSPAPGVTLSVQALTGDARKSAERYRKWKFDRLREEFPDGRYEAGADIGPDEWINLKIDINGTRLIVAVNGTEAPTLTETKATPSADNIGLFVDIGSESFFSDLKVTPN